MRLQLSHKALLQQSHLPQIPSVRGRMLSCEHNVAHNVAHAGFCLNRVDHSTGAPVIRDRLSYIARLLASRLWIYTRICPADTGTGIQYIYPLYLVHWYNVFSYAHAHNRCRLRSTTGSPVLRCRDVGLFRYPVPGIAFRILGVPRLKSHVRGDAPSLDSLAAPGTSTAAGAFNCTGAASNEIAGVWLSCSACWWKPCFCVGIKLRTR